MANTLSKRDNREAWTAPAFGRLFDDWFTHGIQAATTRSLRPAMDVEEDENSIVIRAELPGIAKEEVNVTLEDGVLSITGEKRTDRETKEKSYHLVERTFGAFQRSISLPTGVDGDKADAQFENGVLTITVPKSEAAKPKRLQIK